MKTLSTTEATAAAADNLGEINAICLRGGFPPLTAAEAVNHYYRPNGAPGYSFNPSAPDAGANDAQAFHGSVVVQWEIAYWVTFGSSPAPAYAAQDAAAAEFVEMAPRIAAAVALIPAPLGWDAV